MKQAFDPHRYAVTLTRRGYASDSCGLYRWTGTFWQLLDEQAAKRDAYQWLVRHDRDHASDVCATAAVRAARLWVDALPVPTDDVIVPCRNGYVVLAHQQPVLTPAEPRFGLQYVLNCDYHPEATARRFERFLQEVLPDTAVRGRVQEYIGYTLMSDTRFQMAQFWLGSGANGKGVLANLVQSLHGRAVATRLDELDGFKRAALLGASLIYCDEAPRGRFDESLAKSLIAGELVSIDRKFLPQVDTRILGKWLVLGNHPPVITDPSEGFWRRWDFVPFACTIPLEKRDPLLFQTIRDAELSGVLNWALQGLQRLLERGRFDPVLPPAMRLKRQEVKTEANPVMAWFEECDIAFGTGLETPKDAVYAHFRGWSERNGVPVLTAKSFWERLRQLGDVADGRKRRNGGQIRVCNVELGAR